MTQTFIAFDPAASRVYGVGTSPAEAINDAEFQAGVVLGGTEPWQRLETRPCTLMQAAMVASSNGPASLADLDHAA